jgi:hypothetical protein
MTSSFKPGFLEKSSSISAKFPVSKLESSEYYVYWIYLYSYDQNFMKKKLEKDKIHLFTLSFYTPYRNRALYTYLSHKQLDLNSDDDLTIVINKFKIPTGRILSVSELNVGKNTNVICFELKNRTLKKFIQNKLTFFYTVHNKPTYYIDKVEYLDDDEQIMIPNNRYLLSKIKIHLENVGCVKTRVPLVKIFSFLFDELFETKLGDPSSFIEKKDYSNEQQLVCMFAEMAKKRKLENQVLSESSVGSIKEKKSTASEKASTSSKTSSSDSENCSSDSESCPSDSESCCSDDSQMSFYSYQKKYGLPTNVNIKDI